VTAVRAKEEERVVDAEDLDLESQRADVRTRLAAALRVFAELDFDEGAAGHLSARDPIAPDLFWVNPDGLPFELATASNLVLVDHAGHVHAGDGAPSRAALHLHAAVYAAWPEVRSAMHAHPVHTKAFSSLGRLLDPINQEACIFYGCHAIFERYDGPFSGDTEATQVAQVLDGRHIAVVLANHGLLTVGASVNAAAYRFAIFDRSCRVQMIAEAAGTPRHIDHAVACALAVSEGHCHHSFEPTFTSVLARHPDLAR
jgi:ribulose-5-phosphate 4-epimerase/fuculose-1-phosphate aldolase